MSDVAIKIHTADMTFKMTRAFWDGDRKVIIKFVFFEYHTRWSVIHSDIDSPDGINNAVREDLDDFLVAFNQRCFDLLGWKPSDVDGGER